MVDRYPSDRSRRDDYERQDYNRPNQWPSSGNRNSTQGHNSGYGNYDRNQYGRSPSRDGRGNREWGRDSREGGYPSGNREPQGNPNQSAVAVRGRNNPDLSALDFNALSYETQMDLMAALQRSRPQGDAPEN